MTDVAQTVSTPASSTALANGIQALILALVASKKAGLTGSALVTAAVGAAISDLEPGLAVIGGLSGEMTAEPIGVAEAFTLAGFGTVRSMTGK